MSLNRLTVREKVTLAFWVVAGIVGVWFAHRYFFQAFPEASVNFKVSRDAAIQDARNFLGSLGKNVDGYRTAVEFSVDDHARVYLEREVGPKRANELASGELKLWYWSVRFFKPQQEEEFQVRVSPAGEAVGYTHVVPEAWASRSLDRPAAEAVARDLLANKLGIDLAGWDFLGEEANSIERPKRLDWSFTWEKKGFRAKNAPYRLKVAVLGSEPGGASQFLKVPEAWSRDYEKLRSGNNTLATVFLVPYITILALAVWYAIVLTRNRQTTWRAAIKIGVIATVLLFLQGLNEWPLWTVAYDTKDQLGSFLIQRIVLALLLAVLSALTISLVLPAAEPLYRSSQPEKLQLRYLFTKRGMRTKEFFSALVVGFSMAAAHIGFVVGFYIVASKFGAWAPEDLNYSDAVNTYFPWISGIAVGFLASTNEEFTFRLFAIPLFRKFTGSRMIAIVVPAFLWGFLHSNYPQEPAYIRGIEVGLIGIVAGFVMLRWGILATLTWHYTVDASLVGLLLIRSDLLYFKISGIVVAAAALVPLGLAAISYFSRSGFVEETELLNAAAPKPDLELATTAPPEEVSTSQRRYEALTSTMIALLGVVFVAGALVAWKLKTPHVGDYLKVHIDARNAQQRADGVLRAQGVSTTGFVHGTRFVDVTDPTANEFLRRRIGVEGLNQIYSTKIPGALWSIRYFKNLEPEEYSVVLKPDGSLHSVHHTLAEGSPGPTLSKEQALELAEKYLRDEKHLNLGEWHLVESKSDKKPARTDHKLTWESNAPLDPGASSDHAYARMELNVLGNEVANYRTFIKIPDQWERDQERWTTGRTLYAVATVLFFLGLLIFVLVQFFRNIRSEDAKAVPWRGLARLALWGLVGVILTFVWGNRIAVFLQGYSTAVPFKVLIATLVIGGIIGASFNFGVAAFLLGLAWFFARRAFGQDRLATLRGMPEAYYRDAVLIGVAGAAGWIGLTRLLGFVSAHWPTLERATTSVFGGDFDATYPVVGITGVVLLRGLMAVGIIGLVTGFLASEVKALWLKVLIGLGAAFCLVGFSWGEPADFIKRFCLTAILLGALAFAAVRIVRFNALGWFLAFATVSLGGGAVQMLSEPNRFYRMQGAGLLVVMAIFLIAPFFLQKSTESRS